MAKYVVYVREVHVQAVEIDAETVEDARKLVQDGEGYYIDDSLEYSHCLEPYTWSVKKVHD